MESDFPCWTTIYSVDGDVFQGRCFTSTTEPAAPGDLLWKPDLHWETWLQKTSNIFTSQIKKNILTYIFRFFFFISSKTPTFFQSNQLVQRYFQGKSVSSVPPPPSLASAGPVWPTGSTCPTRRCCWTWCPCGTTWELRWSCPCDLKVNRELFSNKKRGV